MTEQFRDQAPSAAMTYRARKDRSTDELIGLCRGILADGLINETEARFLEDWLYRNREFRASFPFNVLYGRAAVALSDGNFSADEQRDMLEALHSVIGGEHHGDGINSQSTWAPFDNPQPNIDFPGRTFVATGRFAYGPRQHVAAAIEREGGYMHPSITQEVDYLIIGGIGSRDWKHSSFGRKIERAVELRANHSDIAILSEEHFLSQLTPL